jgi:hypothetical protein
MSIIKRPYSIKSLKKQAKLLAKEQNILLSNALNYVAQKAGFTHWSALTKHYSQYSSKSVEEIFTMLRPGHLMLIGAGKNVGKMSFAMNLISNAYVNEIPSMYLSLHLPSCQILNRISFITNIAQDQFNTELLKVLHLKSKHESVIINNIEDVDKGSLVVIDYLQKIPESRLQAFMKKLNDVVKKQNLRLLALTQVKEESQCSPIDMILSGHEIGRHFNHILFLENFKDTEVQDKKNCSLVKSTHYQIQQNVLNFDKNFYRFE